MEIFRVWSLDNCDEEGAEDTLASDAEQAAELFAEKHHSDMDYFTETELCVIDKEGVKTEWTVTVEERPVFYATKKRSAKV